jgi:hypothetical protein
MKNIEPSGPTILNECMDLYMDYLKSEEAAILEAEKNELDTIEKKKYIVKIKKLLRKR